MFGLSAHVFRKSGNVWVEPPLTEHWALGDQNEEGEQIRGHFLPTGPAFAFFSEPFSFNILKSIRQVSQFLFVQDNDSAWLDIYQFF